MGDRDELPACRHQGAGRTGQGSRAHPAERAAAQGASLKLPRGDQDGLRGQPRPRAPRRGPAAEAHQGPEPTVAPWISAKRRRCASPQISGSRSTTTSASATCGWSSSSRRSPAAGAPATARSDSWRSAPTCRPPKSTAAARRGADQTHRRPALASDSGQPLTPRRASLPHLTHPPATPTAGRPSNTRQARRRRAQPPHPARAEPQRRRPHRSGVVDGVHCSMRLSHQVRPARPDPFPVPQPRRSSHTTGIHRSLHRTIAGHPNFPRSRLLHACKSHGRDLNSYL